MKNKSPLFLAGIGLACFLVLFIGLISAIIFLVERDRKQDEKTINTFASCEELNEYVGDTTIDDLYYLYREDDAAVDSPSVNTDGGIPDIEFSETNVQEQGVDEADIIKTDGSKIFLYDGESSTLHFIDATDPSNPEIMQSIDFYSRYNTQLFLSGDRLVAMYNDFDFKWSKDVIFDEAVVVEIFDVSDLNVAKDSQKVGIQGSYMNSRMIDGNMYLVTNSFANTFGKEINVPSYQVNDGDSIALSDCNEVGTMGNNFYTFTNVVSFDIENIEESLNSKVLLGSTDSLYMSTENLYVTSTLYEGARTFGRGETTQDIAPEEPTIETEILKISFEDGEVDFETKGKVPGSILNQFSMDEYYGTFRIATTTNSFSGWNSESANNLYVLDEDLNVQGSVENLAEGEQIYSVRFLGDMAYIVTFEQIDPLFAIDLSDPKNPNVLGELKITGFSNYLHPITEDTLLGIGREANESGRITGLKVTLFDVSDPLNPTVKSDYIYEGSSAQSDATNDHRAVLVDLDKNLLSIPVTSYDYNAKDGDFDFKGFIILNLTEDALEEREVVELQNSTTYYYSQNSRSLYINNNLYLYAGGLLKIVTLDNLEELGELDVSIYDSPGGPVRPLPIDFVE